MILHVLLSVFNLFHAEAAQDHAITLHLDAHTTVEARLMLPDSPTIAGGALILPGSGNVNFDGDVSSAFLGSAYKNGRTDISKQIAEKLATAGIASLRYTKRGYLADAAAAVNQPLDQLAKDAAVAMAGLKTLTSGVKTFVVGFSEGAVVSLLSANIPGAKADAYFLMGLPTQNIDTVFTYQFVEWPVETLSTQLDLNRDGMISAEELKSKPQSTAPILSQISPTKITDLDTNADGALSIASEVVPAYLAFYSNLRGLLATEAYKAWYDSFVALPAFSELAKNAKDSSIYLYQGLNDAQMRWSWILENAERFEGAKQLPKLRFYEGVGHCFSPMDGAIGELKTTGALSEKFLSDLLEDAKEALAGKKPVAN